MALAKRISPSIGDNVKFNVEYPIYHIAKGDPAIVRELIGETHANVLVEPNTLIAVPLADLDLPAAAVVKE